MAIRGKLINLLDCQGIVAIEQNRLYGMITWQIIEQHFEILSLDSLLPQQGIGSQLLTLAEQEASKLGFSHCQLITTNDNLLALAFYQKRGYQLTQLFPNAVAKARDLKPSIPLISENGLPIRDELELTKDIG